MAFRSDKKATYDSITNRISALKSYLADSIAQMAAGNVSGNLIKEVLLTLIQAKTEMTAAASVPGIGDYAKAQEGDLLYDVAAEFSTLSTAIDTAGGWILTNMPASGGYIQLEEWDASGVTVRTFAPAATAGLRTNLQVIVDAIT